MSLFDEVSFDDLRNEAERLVLEELERQLSDAGPEVCRTQECILDMAAFALNLVRPMYRVTLLGRLYATATTQSDEKMVESAVRKAIQKISINPPN